MFRRAIGFASAIAATSYLNCQYRIDPFARSKIHQKVSSPQGSDIVLIPGNSNLPLATEISEYLNCPLADCIVSRFVDGEVKIQIQVNVRGKDAYIIQSTCPPVNENLMELLLLISTMRRSSAKKITAVIPYYGYARQDRKMSSRVPISAADTAKLLEAMGVDRVIACDLHCGQIQGFFGPRVPVDNLDASIVALDYFHSKNLQSPIVVSPDAGGVYRAKRFQELLTNNVCKPGLAMIIKQRSRPNEIGRMDLVGSVEGSDAIIVDDMIDTAGTLCEAAAQLRKFGAKRIFAYATHGLFSGNGVERINESVIEQVVVSNTIPLSKADQVKHDANGDKIIQISVGLLLAEAIRREHQKESLSELFYPKTYQR